MVRLPVFCFNKRWLTCCRFCLELNSARTQQSATLKLFKIVSQYAKSVPIIVVATKKDEFIGVKVMEARKKIGSIGKDANEYFTALDEYAEAQFWERMKTIEKELVEIEGGRFDASVGVSKGKPSKLSISFQRSHVFYQTTKNP
jgi:hypothetical protein